MESKTGLILLSASHFILFRDAYLIGYFFFKSKSVPKSFVELIRLKYTTSVQASVEEHFW